MKNLKRFLCVVLGLMLCLVAVSFGACDNEPKASDAVDADVYAPDGAPALALAQLMKEEMQFSGSVRYHVVAATTIQTYVTGEDPQAELCVIPVNAAAQLLGSGEKYVMLGTVTHGNIYILSNTEKTPLTADNLDTLIGKVVGSIQLTNVVGLTLRLVLEQNDIAYTIIEDVSQKKDDVVNIINIPDPATMITGTANFDYMVAAEPVVSTKTGAIATLEVVGDLQELYGEGGYPQAVLVAKADFAEKNEQFIQDFIQAVEENAAWIMADSTESATIVDAVASHLPEGSTPTFKTANLTKGVIENCAIRFQSAIDSKEEVKSFLSKLSGVSNVQYNVADSFFYSA